MRVELAGFSINDVSVGGQRREVYRCGDTGPAVIVLAEIPGITPAVAAFAERVAAAGFQVYMPQLFGTPGKPMSLRGTALEMGRACISREFSLLKRNGSSPVVEWLRGLAQVAHDECGGSGVGVVGMCITGNFGLAMMLDSPVIAPVLSQPSLPVGISPGQRSALHVSAQEIAAAHEKIDDQGARILGLRFKSDLFCTGARFEALREEFGDAFEAIEIEDRHARKGTGTPPHSVLTTHLIDAQGEPTSKALDRTLEFLNQQLMATEQASG